MSRSSGRFSRYPAVNRDVPGHGATYPERSREAGRTAQEPTGAKVEPVVEEAPDVDAMTVAEVLAWAGDDVDRQRVALEAELAGRGRRGIVEAFGG